MNIFQSESGIYTRMASRGRVEARAELQLLQISKCDLRVHLQLLCCTYTSKFY